MINSCLQIHPFFSLFVLSKGKSGSTKRRVMKKDAMLEEVDAARKDEDAMFA